jgi:hypothetical protein
MKKVFAFLGRSRLNGAQGIADAATNVCSAQSQIRLNNVTLKFLLLQLPMLSD